MFLKLSSNLKKIQIRVLKRKRPIAVKSLVQKFNSNNKSHKKKFQHQIIIAIIQTKLKILSHT